jgi:S-DNA-T family DNA segregation ATPase FtsK/SpoIIIE
MSLAMVAGMVITINMGNANNPAAMITSAIITGSMLLGAILWPVLTRRHQKKTARKDEKHRIEKYRAYIANTNIKLSEMLEINRKALVEIYPPIETCLSIAEKRGRKLWERTPHNDDFTDVRIGRGHRPFTVNINVQKERFVLEDDPLKQEMFSMTEQYKYIGAAPITVSMLKEGLIGFIGDRLNQTDLLRCLIIQLSVLHSYDEVKFIFIYNRNERDKWGFAKWLPHSWSEGQNRRFIATEQDEVREIFNSLTDEINARILKAGKEAQTVIPHYCIFIMDLNLAENEPVIKLLINQKDKTPGITLAFLGKHMH